MNTNYEMIGHVIGQRLAPLQAEIDELKKEVLALKELNNLLKPDVSGSLQCTDKEYKDVMKAIYPKHRS